MKDKGNVGRNVSLEDGQAAAKLCYKWPTRTKLRDPSFTDHAKVINGASNFLVEIFGEKGKHARVSVGAHVLLTKVRLQII